MKIVVPLPRHHDGIPPPRPRLASSTFTALACALFVATGIGVIFGKLNPPGKSSKTSDVIWGVAAVVVFGAVGLTTIPELFPNRRPLFGDRVILDEDGVRHPHHAQLVPWRDIVRANTHAARWAAHDPEFTLLHLWLIDDPARYRGPINIHASCDEEMFPLPPTMDFSLEHCRVPAEEVLRFAQEKIAAHRA